MTRREAIARLRRKPPVPPEERERFVGVTNAYLEHRLALLGLRESVEGTPELLKPCPCCELRTLDGEAYDICRVCFWEDDGTVELDVISDCNHCSLREARQTFERVGAVREDLVVHVLRDGRERYAR